MTKLSSDQLRDPGVFISTLGGVGFLRPAPGTWGSLAALFVWWPIVGAAGLPIQLICIALAVVGGTWVVDWTAKRCGVHDDGAIVIDELAGMWLTLVAVPQCVWAFVLGFALFRLFDIWKPWPVSWADRRVPGGFGVMLDDLIAGLLAAVVLNVTLWQFGGLLDGCVSGWLG